MVRKNRKNMSSEIFGSIVGFIMFAILVGVSWTLGYAGILAIGWGDIILGLLFATLFGYLYAALNRKRRYDWVMFIMLLGYALGAYIIEPLFPEGQFVGNLAESNSPVSFLIWIFLAVFLLVGLIAPFFYAKRSSLR